MTEMIVSDYLTAPKRTEADARADRYKQDLCALCLAVDCSFEAAERALVTLGTDDGDAAGRLATYADTLVQELNSVWKARQGVRLP